MTTSSHAKRRSPRHIRIFLSSPGDVEEERSAVREMLQRLGRSPLIREDFTIEVVSWDDPDAPVPMLATVPPQQAVSRARPTPSECDFTVVIIARRIGTPLGDRKPDGSLYKSGTEWEFEDARRADKPILLYRRKVPVSVPDDAEEAAQLQKVQAFFSQFTTEAGVATGGVTAYRTVDELVSRLRTDIEALLPALRHGSDLRPDDPIMLDARWTARAQARIRGWHYGRLLMLLAAGFALTVVAWAAFSAFSTVVVKQDAPRPAHVVRYAFLVLGMVIPAALFVVSWWWFGGARRAKVQ